MMEWTPIILAVTGLALLVTEIWAARTNGRKLPSLSKRGQILYIASSSIVGIALVIVSLYPEYRLRPDLRVFGVPFMTVALRFERGHWIDFPSLLALPALAGNAVVAFFLPQLIVAGLWRSWRLRP